jgi:hypothetical protein
MKVMIELTGYGVKAIIKPSLKNENIEDVEELVEEYGDKFDNEHCEIEIYSEKTQIVMFVNTDMMDIEEQSYHKKNIKELFSMKVWNCQNILIY